jgi:hypothetical protein
MVRALQVVSPAGGERSCINVSGIRLKRVVLRAIMDISARAFSLADRPRLGHLGHQCSHAPGRPNLHIVSSSRRPRLETVDRVTSSLAPHIAQFLCSSQGPFLRPGPQNVDRVARRGGHSKRTSVTSPAGRLDMGALEPQMFPFPFSNPFALAVGLRGSRTSLEHRR